MKKNLALFLTLLLSANLFAESFKTLCEVPITQVKDQNNTSTCWAFATLSVLESEAIRMGADNDIDLSERWILYNTYPLKAQKYVMLNSQIRFAQGGCLSDVLWVAKNFGLVAEEEMPSICFSDEYDVMTQKAKNYLDTVINQNAFNSNWMRGYNEIIDKTLGDKPKSIEPISYVKLLKINTDDYILLTSFYHHDYYKPFALELPDNWRWTLSYNVPLDEFMQIIDHALKGGYSLGWAADISEPGFSENGIAHTNVVKVSESKRLESFLNKSTTDDHAMQIFGIAQNENGEKFYMMKNSWGNTGDYGGIWYFSEDYVRYKTINLLVNIHALPNSIARRLGF